MLPTKLNPLAVADKHVRMVLALDDALITEDKVCWTDDELMMSFVHWEAAPRDSLDQYASLSLMLVGLCSEIPSKKLKKNNKNVSCRNPLKIKRRGKIHLNHSRMSSGAAAGAFITL